MPLMAARSSVCSSGASTYSRRMRSNTSPKKVRSWKISASVRGVGLGSGAGGASGAGSGTGSSLDGALEGPSAGASIDGSLEGALSCASAEGTAGVSSRSAARTAREGVRRIRVYPLWVVFVGEAHHPVGSMGELLFRISI